MVCLGRQVADLVKADPFADRVAREEDGQFISVLEKLPRNLPAVPYYAPAGKDWQVGVLAIHGRFVVSVLRRVGRTLPYPNEVVERHFGVAATTRNWQTILKVAALLEADVGRAAHRRKLGLRTGNMGDTRGNSGWPETKPTG